mgnify:CR=1 FL=1
MNRLPIPDWSTGLATSIAIILHELPHELGDFVIYKKFGLSNAKALGANLFAAMISFGGLYLGLSLAQETEAANWLLSIVTGLFIYIALVDIVRTFNWIVRIPAVNQKFIGYKICTTNETAFYVGVFSFIEHSY